MKQTREIIQGDALAWMAASSAPKDASVVTSLPDVSELGHLGIDAWRSWFVGAARAVMQWVPDEGVAIFYQSDVRHHGVWIDKGYLVMRAAEEEKVPLVWHKIVCRKPPGTVALGRPSYSHMLCVSRTVRGPGRRPGPDVLPDAGAMPWSRAMGIEACRVACAYLRSETATRVVVDPFCGRGTVLAVANAMGFDAMGVDLSAKRCRAARALSLEAEEGDDEDRIARGARLFDQGRFFEAHEAWEERWRVEEDAIVRRALQGLIQVAAALHKLVVLDEPESAARLLAKGLGKLDQGPPALGPLDLRAFALRARGCERAISEGSFTVACIPRIT